jgi:MarR family 2-MHQ and catechol resistance regulon transcriptional repressor
MGTRFQGSREQKLALDTYIKLNRCLNAIGARIARECPLPEGLTTSQFGVLEALLHCGPLSQQEVGRKTLRSRGNITMVVDNLERAGLVRRERDMKDRRRYLLHLTEKGGTLIKGYFPLHAESITRSMSVLSVEEQIALGALCRKLGLGLQQE